MNNQVEVIKSLKFGTELEYVNISRCQAIKALKSVIGGDVKHEGGSYDTWTLTAPDGRVWKAVSDGSLGNSAHSAEIVTPILGYDDIETLQEAVRALRKVGAKATDLTSQHVHVGIAHFTPAQVANLARIFYKQEELLLHAIGTLPRRLERYTKRTDHSFIDRLEQLKPTDNHDLNLAWFGTYKPNPTHYDGARYRALNLNNLWGNSKTAEIRAFNGTTHAGEVRTNIILSLAIVAKAFTAKAASSKKQRPYNVESAKYDTRVFLLRLGLIGNEFKNVRMHILKNLPGSAAWKHGSHIA